MIEEQYRLDIDLIQKLNLLRTILEITEGREKAAIEGEIVYLETHLGMDI